MPKIDFSQVLHQLNGEPFKEQDGNTTRDATLGSLACQALSAFGSDPQRQATAQEKFKAGVLAVRIYGQGVVELTLNEADFVKERIGELAAPVVIVQAFNMMEQKELAAVKDLGERAAAG
jgi:hypothetical protein